MKFSAIAVLSLVGGAACAADDIDRKVEPCNDFFAYANGAWRAQHPIPASMPRGSRRWAAGETNKDRLKIILEATTATRARPGSIDQLTGDFYAGCMDEARIDRLGVEPLRPQLTAIASLRDNDGLQREIQRLHAMNVRATQPYLSWHLLHSAAPSLSKPFVQEDFAFNSAYLHGAKEMKPRRKQARSRPMRSWAKPSARCTSRSISRRRRKRACRTW